MIALYILIVIASKAMDVSDKKALYLLNAQNYKKLKVQLEKTEHEKKLKSACEYELVNNLIPHSCFTKNQTRKETEALDLVCVRAAGGMTEIVDTKNLSPKCKEIVKKKNDDLRYRQAEKNPVTILQVE